MFALLLISTEFIIVSNILPSRLTAQIDRITVDHQCGFGRNRSTADHIMSDGQILEMKWNNSGSAPAIYKLHYNV